MRGDWSTALKGVRLRLGLESLGLFCSEDDMGKELVERHRKRLTACCNLCPDFGTFPLGALRESLVAQRSVFLKKTSAGLFAVRRSVPFASILAFSLE
jgi:hypothetical protein